MHPLCYPIFKREEAMELDHILSVFSPNKRELANLQVKSLFVFGSVARGEAKKTSDIDLLVNFYGSPTFDQYMDLKFFLEELFFCKIDLVTENGVRKSYSKDETW